jgi:hypothetical protein
MTTYAANTSVSVENSRAEIERTLRRYKADAFGYSTDGCRAMVAFRISERHVRFLLTMPSREAPEFCLYKQGHTTYRRVETEAEKRWEQACRQKWRALALVIKAKLEAVSAGITTIEDEFLAHTVMGDGRTVGEIMQPQIAEHYRVGGPPSLMLEGPRA